MNSGSVDLTQRVGSEPSPAVVPLRAWGETKPPHSHWVAASYSVMDKLLILKTCRRGCCVHGPVGTMRLPLYWRDATPDEIAQEVAYWDSINSLSTGLDLDGSL